MDDLGSLFFADLPGEILPVTLEGADDVEFFVFVGAWLDRAPVDHDGGAVQPAHRHQTSRHVFVATGQCDQTVVPLRTHNRFDRVGDQIAAL